MSWTKELASNYTKAKDLLDKLPMTAEDQCQMDRILEQFPMSITPYYLGLIDFDDPADPIRKMAIPSIGETDLSGSFDTSGEADNTVVPGLQHKYNETVLILSTNACAMYCRHCFRKRLVGLSDDEVASSFGAMGEYIRSHGEISNVLVSGGDALLNSNDRLRKILEMLVDIDHLDFIRLGSRVPVVFPSRITGDAELLALLGRLNAKKQLMLVTQYNHPRELTPQSLAAVKAVLELGIPVRNQTVLLRGVNDDAAVLAALLKGLTAAGVQPYYVFQCRPVSGVKNQFQVPLRTGYRIVEDAKRSQNGMGKCFRYCLSHVTGKVEILGELNEREMLFKYQECKNTEKLGTLFTQPVDEAAAWLPHPLK